MGLPEKKIEILVRKEMPADMAAIRAVNQAAFAQTQEADLVDRLRKNCRDLLSLVETVDRRPYPFQAGEDFRRDRFDRRRGSRSGRGGSSGSKTGDRSGVNQRRYKEA